MTDLIPPHDVEAEIAVLGSLLLITDPVEAKAVLDTVLPADFYRGPHADVFRYEMDLWEGTSACDTILLRNSLAEDGILEKVGGTSFISRITEATPSAKNAVHYARIVRKRSLERRVLEASHEHEHATREHGNGTADLAFEKLSRARDNLAAFGKPKKPAHDFAPVGAFTLLSTTLPPIEELVRGRVVYRGGTTVLVASHKRGKSLASLGLCVDLVAALLSEPIFDVDAVELAPKWLGQPVVGRGPVCVYSAEGGERMIQERLRKMVPSPTEHHDLLLVYARQPTPQLDNPEHLDAVFRQAETHGAVLLVIDPLGRFWAMEDEADPTAARNLMQAIQTRAEAAYGGRGIAVLIVHHDTKATGSDEHSAVTGGRGSGKFGDDADALVNLKILGHGEPGQSTAHFLLRHGESPAPALVRIDKETLRLVSEDPANAPPPKTTGRPPKCSLDSVEKLVRRKGAILTKRIPDELGVSYGTWKNLKRNLLRDLTAGGEFAVGSSRTGEEEVRFLSPGQSHESHETPIT